MTAKTAHEKLNILVVEDETMIAMFLDDMLTDLGCNVVGPAAAVAPALALIEANGHLLDGALLDVNLRGELAYPIADALARWGIPFVFVTGYAAGGIEVRYAAIPAVTKPFRFATLEATVKGFASHHPGGRTVPRFARDRGSRQPEAAGMMLTSRQ
jgi:DNA-binding response OmpR family regulator